MPEPCFPRQAPIQGLRPHEAVLVRRLQHGEHRKEPKPIIDDAEGKDGGFSTLDGCLMIFEGSTAYNSKRHQKLVRREVYMAESATLSFL